MAMPLKLQKRILRDSYSVSPVKGFMRTEMEVGPARQRRIATAMPTNIQFKLLLLSRRELAILETWYKRTISNGASWFMMPIDCGSGFVDTDCRFTEPYTVSAIAFEKYEVSCQVECREMPTLTESDLGDDLD